MRLSEVERDGLGRTPSNLLEPYIESIISRHCALEREARDAEWKAALTNDGAGGTGLTDHFKSLLEAHDAEVGQQASANHLRMREEMLKENEALRAENKKLLAALQGIMSLIDRGELVRDTSHDHESSYALRVIKFVMTLKAAQEALLKSPAPQAQGNE